MSRMDGSLTKRVAIIGAGPAGLFAAQHLAEAGLSVSLFDQRPSPARKFLMAGLGGLNLTHSEPLEAFLGRYRPAHAQLLQSVRDFPPAALQDWSAGLDEPTFAGSSGKVFPKSFKASPLLRRWLRLLDQHGVTLHSNTRWHGFDEDGALLLQEGEGPIQSQAFDAVLLALGGGSWAKLGSDGSWVSILREHQIGVKELLPANCGFEISFSEHFKERFKGTPLKKIAVSHAGNRVVGDAMLDATGIEGGVVYALSAELRDAVLANGTTQIEIDLKPDVSANKLTAKLARPRGKQSMSNFLRKATGLPAAAIALMREAGPLPAEPEALAALIKALPLQVTAPRPIDRAISSAGGISFDEINEHYMLTKLPGVFVAGEMLDWEAPTGGYLLQAVFATGRSAALGIASYLQD
ncbi:NAD(FAD)-utilizing dehydrogenase [Pseudovibrio japonicus]|uniref:NAD(FAD)-utilizing dehydrogenase n=2 Tax=Pseudovibrio japonicus TaxID=366534 RepID=A0ABQ3ELV5_9HYPH|nr:NAD(FAD)-utilizing dehydrogenase [Pseudovibrio japonicus]